MCRKFVKDSYTLIESLTSKQDKITTWRAFSFLLSNNIKLCSLCNLELSWLCLQNYDQSRSLGKIACYFVTAKIFRLHGMWKLCT